MRHTDIIFYQIFQRFVKFATFICFTLILSNPSNADGWVRKKGKGIFISSLEIKSFRGINTTGNWDKNKRIHQTSLSLYGEYGLTSRITIGAKVIGVDSYETENQRLTGKIKNRSFALDTTQFFTRIGIIRKSKIVALSISQIVQLPSFYKLNNDNIGYFSIKYWSYEPRLELGINITKSDFIIFTAGYHYNIKNWYDEIRGELTWGHFWFDNLLMMVKFQKYAYLTKSYTKMVKAYSVPNNSIFNFIANAGFAKINLSFTTALNENLILELGAYSSIKSKITYTKNLALDLYGCYASIWYNF